MPDGKYFKEFYNPVLFPGYELRPGDIVPHSKYEPPIKKKVKNMILNFGPQHPAAHGVLRLILELDNEVGF